MQMIDFRVLVLEQRPFQLLDLERLLNRCGCFNLTPAIDASDLELLIEQGQQFDLLVCKESSLNARQRERDLLELMAASGYVSQVLLIRDASTQEKKEAWSRLRSLCRSSTVSLTPPLTPERIRPYLLPRLLQLIKSA